MVEPHIGVFHPQGSCAGKVYDLTTAAMLVATLGDGATVRLGKSEWTTIYTQGDDGDANESYDEAVLAMESNL